MTMTRRMDLDALGKTLQQAYAAAGPPLTVAVGSAGHQLTVAPRDNEPAPESGTGLKQSTRPPPRGKAFELYVSLESPASAASGQRIAPPPQTEATLGVEEGRHAQMWTLPGPAGELVVVRLRRGEDMTDEDARRLLRIVQGAIPT
jgi:hypothetical protein